MRLPIFRFARIIGFAIVLFGISPIAIAQEKRIVGYLPDYRMEAMEWKSIPPLTDLVLFSAQIDEDGSLNTRRLANAPWDKLKQAKTNHRMRLILCVGGWERSDAFSKVSLDESSRKKFAQSVTQFCLSQRLDGIDLDWEHPKNTQEQQGYHALIRDLRTALQPHGLLLTITMAAWQELPRDAFDLVDYVQIMSYDHPGKHSTIEDARKDIDMLLKKGAKREQLVLGLPLYGRHIKNADQVLTYREIVSRYHPMPSSDEADGYYFNGRETIRRKSKLVLEEQLGGVMVWEIGQDAVGKDSLIKTLSIELISKVTE